jgi:hypothetical protein
MAIDKFFPYVQKGIPMAYDDSLSYYEAVLAVINKVNEAIDLCNDFKADLDSREKSSWITNNRKLSPDGNFTGKLEGRTTKTVLADLDKKEYKDTITYNRKLSPQGVFTGKLANRSVTQVLIDISDSLSLAKTIIHDVNNRESIGTIYDGGYFLDTVPITYSIEGGLF